MKAKWLVGMAAAILLLAPTAEAQRGGQARSGRGVGGGPGIGRSSQVSRGGVDRGARPSRVERSSPRLESPRSSGQREANVDRAPKVERSAPAKARVERAQPSAVQNVARGNDRKGHSPLASGAGRGPNDRASRGQRTEIKKPGGPTSSIPSPGQSRVEKPGASRPRTELTERPLGSVVGRDPKVEKRPSVIEGPSRPIAPPRPAGSTSADLSRTGELGKDSPLNTAQANNSTLRNRARPGAESRTERKPDRNPLPGVLEENRRDGDRRDGPGSLDRNRLGRDGDRRDGPGGRGRDRLGRDGDRDDRRGDFDRDRRGDRDRWDRNRGRDWKGNDCDWDRDRGRKYNCYRPASWCGPSWGWWGDWCGWGSGLSVSIGTSWSWGSLYYNYNSCAPYYGSWRRPYYYGSCYRPDWSSCWRGSWWCDPWWSSGWCASPGVFYFTGPGYDWGVSDVGYSTTSPNYNYSWSSPSSRYGWVENNYSGTSTYQSQAGDSVGAFHEWQESLNGESARGGDGEVTLAPPAGTATTQGPARKPDPDDRRVEPVGALGAGWEMLGDGRDADALEFFAGAIERDSTRASAQTGYGVASLLMGRMDAAEFALRRAVATNALSLGFLPVDARLAGRLSEASRGLRTGADTGSEWLLVGIVDYIRHDRAGAAEALTRAMELGESDPAARTLLEVVK